ncbi:hypothetical protein PYW07_009532 [Mythimna separata]|uniref:Uncharacterized protein n=1 Tax=Mythimna separata TaxID=271217 RepID=A0AAD8DNA0_MYTSE|nr:hypothetical protein PYW07_009532 [Mythimna separata]
MNEEKLSGDKVPEKFAEWLLSMGCPPDKVPPVDKLADMCRGHYYMVWRSLMEHVEPKQSIRQKRLQVFANDVQRCQKKNAFCKPDSSVVVPEELSLWKQQTAQRERVEEAETRVTQARQELNQLVDKFSSKLSQRDLTRGRVQAAQRRAWLLQQLAEELRNKKYNLQEARSIADSLCTVEDCDDLESKLDKVTSRRQNSRPPGSLSMSGAPLANSTVSSNGDLYDTEDQVGSLVKCGGALWPQLCSRRAALITALQAPTVHDTTDANSSLVKCGGALWPQLCSRRAALITALQAPTVHDTTDANSSLVKCGGALWPQLCSRRAALITALQAPTVHDTTDANSSLVKCGGALWPQLCSRRAALITALQAPTVHDTTDANRITPQWVLSHTAALHCSLALNALKSKLHLTHPQKRLAAAVLQLNDNSSMGAVSHGGVALLARSQRAQEQAAPLAHTEETGGRRLTAKRTYNTTRSILCRITPQWVLSHTAALHCSLALNALKSKLHLSHTQKRLAAAVLQLNDNSSMGAVSHGGVALLARSQRAQEQAAPLAHTEETGGRRLTAKRTYNTTRSILCRITPQWVLSHTAALHCSLALNALKSKLHLSHTQKRLAAAVLQLNDYISGPSCELVVARCERAGAEARLHALRALHDEMTSRSGVFEAPGGSAGNRQAAKQIAVIDKAIESKHEELRRLISSLAVTERKIQTVRECLITVFGSFHSEAAYTESERFGGQKSLPQESVSSLRRFYEERRERHRNNVNLSMDLDTSENCSYDAAENANPTFVDELKIYLKKFKLEKNRKLVLDSGEKIWIFETLQSSIERLHSSWQREDVTCSLVCPSVSLSRNLLRLVQLVERREWMEGQLKALETSRREDKDIDITAETEEEQRTIDKIKKRLNENIISLQKTTKNVDLLREDLSLWSENEMKKYISCNRTVDGKTYKEYEGFYRESLT